MPNPLVGWGHFPHLLTSAAPESNVFLYNVVLSMCGIPGRYREIDDIARFITFKPHYWQETEEWNGHVPVNIHDIPFGYKLLLWASHKARVLNTTGQCPSGAELMIELSQMVLLWMNYITVHTVHYHQMIHANDHSDRGEHVIYKYIGYWAL